LPTPICRSANGKAGSCDRARGSAIGAEEVLELGVEAFGFGGAADVADVGDAAFDAPRELLWRLIGVLGRLREAAGAPCVEHGPGLTAEFAGYGYTRGRAALGRCEHQSGDALAHGGWLQSRLFWIELKTLGGQNARQAGQHLLEGALSGA